MNFARHSASEPEINLIAFIDVLLVVLIFLMLSTTYSKFTQLQVNLPSADAEPGRDYPREIIVSIAADGRIAVLGQLIESKGALPIGMALKDAAAGAKSAMVVISADALASHQSVVTVMEGARVAGLHQITFATQRNK